MNKQEDSKKLLNHLMTLFFSIVKMGEKIPTLLYFEKNKMGT